MMRIWILRDLRLLLSGRKVLPLSMLRSKQKENSSAASTANFGSPSEDTEVPGTEGSSKKLKMTNVVPDVEILSSTEVFSLKPLASKSVFEDSEEKGHPSTEFPAKEVYEGPSVPPANPVISSGISARGIEPFRLVPSVEVKGYGGEVYGFRGTCSALRKELGDVREEFRVAKDDLNLIQTEKASLEKRVVELGDASARSQEENKNLIKELETLRQDPHLLITKGLPYFFSKGLVDSVFQRHFKRLSYYQKAIGEHKMALHYHLSFEGVELEEMPGYNPNAVTKAQEAKGALHQLALDYHKVLADNAHNPTPVLMGIRAKRLMPNPDVSTSRIVAAQGVFGAGDGEGEVNQMKAS
ncbi:OLC1v1029874C1 [Oldenlandia corymbosa var. corymbosa]|uniref:OLC1v1029874C1 n=1 Tax=Oldenlandia corymbosa var. corymbosa TaxID=529605 RepID=A0AAV1CEQ8_OLDCO|nr:OLC1v1029874C1 [Oldenlandia corymbosa var. corymbosa]